MTYTRSSIEELITRKLGKTYERYAYSVNGNRVLLGKLKEVLNNEVGDMLKRNEMISPPFDPFRITKIGKSKIITIYVPKSEIGADGSIEASDDGFVVKINKVLAEEHRFLHRLRSTMAHELMHTFFYDVNQLPPSRIGHNARTWKQLFMEEELSSYLARVFLIPDSSIFDLIHNKEFLKPSLTNISKLKSIFVVSADIIAYRMITDLCIWDAIFIRFLKDRGVLRSVTKLKNKSNQMYKRIKIPFQLPSEFSGAWQKLLLDHINETIKQGSQEEIVRLVQSSLALESKVETINPMSIITLGYEHDDKSDSIVQKWTTSYLEDVH